MTRPKIEWDPSWDDGWQSVQGKLEQEVEDEHPLNPREAVEFYRFGFGAARKHPLHDWSDVETELYQDYMSGAPEPGEAQADLDWEQARSWIYRGWHEAHSHIA